MNESANPCDSPGGSAAAPLTATGRLIMLTVAFLGWLFAGVLMSITTIAMQPAVVDLLGRTGQLDRGQYLELSRKSQAGKSASGGSGLSAADQELLAGWKAKSTRWVAWMTCAFLFGAAAGGLIFGAVGDGFGRARGMGFSILTYSLFSAAAWFSDSPWMLCLCWFLACLGVGGMWPNGVALVSEAWASLSRPMAAGIIGTAANVGIFLMSTLATKVAVTSSDWRWVMLVAAAPVVLGIFSLLTVPESPQWLASRRKAQTASAGSSRRGEIFRAPFLRVTLVGIGLATIPIIGGWGSANWMVPWAAEAGDTADPPNPTLKATVSQTRAITGIVGSFLGGWIASALGRRLTFFLASFGSLVTAQYAFWFLYPGNGEFLWWVAALGLFNGVYFGWLPLCLPELFPTRVRAAGSGVSFNFGRILSAVTVFASGTLTQFFEGDYARIGRATSLIFLIGMVLIAFAPDTSGRRLDE